MPRTFRPEMVAQGWNIDQLAGLRALSSSTAACGRNVGRARTVCLGTLLGPEGPGDHARTFWPSETPAQHSGAGCWKGTCPRRTTPGAVWMLLEDIPRRLRARDETGPARPYLENCTVDASIKFCSQVNKGARWMPWHQEPMKDVGGCDKPRGAVNRAVIRGFPNGETRQESCPVTHT